MSRRYPDGYTLIGLHKLAEQDGHGVVTELHTLILDRAGEQPSYANVILFPAWEARMPDEAPAPPSDETGTVLTFPHWAAMGRRCRG